MASRNRTLLFRKYRDALKSVRAPSTSSPPSTSSAGGPVIELVSTSLLNPNRSYAPLSTEDPGNSSKGPNAITVGLPPAWVDVSEEISANVQRARKKMAELSKAHAKALMPSFGDGKDDQHAIESLTHEVTDLIKRSEKRLRRLAASGPSEDSNVRKNVQRSLATDLQNLSVELRKKQSTYLKRLRQQKEGQDGVDLEINMNGSKSRFEDDDLDNMIFNEHQMAKLKKSEAFTVEREKEIQQVVESVNELAQIMKDLSVLVIDQGTIVDRIDYNIQNVATTVEDGLKQLQKVLLLFIVYYFGREISEKGGHGNVCFGASYHVLCYVGFLSHKGNYLVIRGDISYHILYNIGHL
ncbi:tlg2p-like protein a isoform X1 [Cicer arietinum]|uniref:Syntaxin-41 isoform X1 n=1 Tax=Cicer arietinum TaxID=3827 RepID=A0A1S2XWN0_CICAR|nr:syntaxin-41 isoform X1 [Cicer arietinum]